VRLKVKYNFDEIIDRRNTYAEKYMDLEKRYGRSDVIPLWAADMDFRVAQPVIDAIKDRAENGIFGYTARPDSFCDAVCNFQKKRKDWTIDKSLISFSTGVVPAISMIINEFTAPEDGIIIQTPVYPAFSNSVKHAKRQLIESPLKEIDGRFFMDFDDLEEKAAQGAKYIILCSPHNPVGRVWEKWELQKLGDICLRYGLKVISDEIHSDIILWGKKHIPFASVSEKFREITITCIAPSKTFNLAGLQSAMVIFPNSESKNKYDWAWAKLHVESNNCLSMVATQAAFEHGEEWLDQLLKYLEGNISFLIDYFKNNIPLIKPIISEGTYLVWLDCRELGLSGEHLNKFMIFEAGLVLSSGINYGINGNGFMRLNPACPRSVLEKALGQLKVAVDEFYTEKTGKNY
jgi:cystathionine beta-lyase